MYYSDEDEHTYHIVSTKYKQNIKRKKDAIDIIETIKTLKTETLLETISIINESIKEDENELAKMNLNWKVYKESLTM
jgi:predicted HAD superfamily phosphohydrolase